MPLRRTNTTFKRELTQIEFLGDEGSIYLLLNGRPTKNIVELYENEGVMKYVYKRLLQVMDERPYLPNKARAKENVLKYLMEDVISLIADRAAFAEELAEVLKNIGVWWQDFDVEPFI